MTAAQNASNHSSHNDNDDQDNSNRNVQCDCAVKVELPLPCLGVGKFWNEESMKVTRSEALMRGMSKRCRGAWGYFMLLKRKKLRSA